MNAVLNAAKCTKEGSITITLKFIRRTIVIGAGQSSIGVLTVSVRDTGKFQ
jgi:hypothetical protein